MEKTTIKRNQGSLEKREHIFRTAMELFQKQGYGCTTVRDICRTAEVSNGSFYHFFGDKSGVLLLFLNRLFSQREDALAPTPAHLASPFQAIYDYLLFVADTQDILGREFARELITNPELLMHQQVSSRRLNAQNQIISLLHHAIEAGTIAPTVCAEEVAEFLWTGAGGTLFQWITLNEGESAGAMTRRMLPKIFAAVTDKQIVP